MAGYIYGNNFGDLAGNKLANDQFYFNVAKNAQDAYQRNQDNITSTALAQQRQQQEDARLSAEQQYQYYANAQAQQREQQANAKDDYRFGVGEADKAAGRAQEQYQFGANMDLQKQQTAAKTTQNDANTKFSEAATLVKNGKYDDSPDDIVTDFPGLNPQQYAVLNSLWDAKNKKSLTQFAKTAAEADAANASLFKQPGYLDKNRMQLAAHGITPVITPTSTNFVPTMAAPYGQPAYQPPPAPVSTNAPPPVAAPASHWYNPASWGRSAPAAPSNIAPTIPAPVAPTAATPAPYSFGQPQGLPDRGTVVAPPADTDKTAQGGYKIGTRYKGGLVYLGGDPADPASWQQGQ